MFNNAHSKISDWVVVVVDDEPDSIEVVTEVLEFYGATVHNASNGLEALSILERVTPTLLLTDLSMPIMDGWALLSNVRKNPLMAHVPIIALTAHAMDGDKERGLAAGFTSYLTKPVNAITLITDILSRVPSLV